MKGPPVTPANLSSQIKRTISSADEIHLGFALALLALEQIKQTKQAQPEQDRYLIVGAWSLTSYELRLKPSRKITTPFGPHLVGRILYEANGQMSASSCVPT